jgi:2-polyprenyl-3-methyl-5-hydroxy-6-metoxy-1,4-benzoquinol methylase
VGPRPQHRQADKAAQGMKRTAMRTEAQISGDLNGLLSPFLHRRRFAAVRPYLRGRRWILDVGCGVFAWDNQLPPGVEYVGVDCQEAVIQYNRTHTPHTFLLADVEEEDLRIPHRRFDLVLLLAVLEHFYDPRRVLERLAPLLCPEGIIAMTVPHPTGSFILSAGARFRIFAQDKSQHHSLLDEDGLKRLASDAGYEPVAYRRFLCGFNQLVIMKKAADHEHLAT